MDCGIASKLVLVTGSTSGIGKAIARQYASVGARVLVNGRTIASVEAAIADIRATLPATAASAAELIPLVGDVGSKEGVDALIVEAERHGSVEILVNNVGIFGVKDFTEITDEEWDKYYQLNTMSCVRLCRHFLPKMLAADWGRIVLISSEVAERPLPHMIAYSVSKASQVNLARGLAELTKGTGVTVNSVLPGPTWTEGVEVYMKGYADMKGQTLEEACKTYFSENETTSLLARYLKVEEVANVVVFLGSQLGAGINGNAQRVDGGIIRHI